MKTYAMVILVSLLSSTLALAKPQKVRLHGLTILADEIGYYAGSKKISNFTVLKLTTLPLARGNQIQASGLVYLDQNGDVSLVVSNIPQVMNWKTPDGQIVPLDCSVQHDGLGDVGRAVTFQSHEEYKEGCQLKKEQSFSGPNYDVRVSGKLSVRADFSLLYASQVVGGTLKSEGESVSLLPESELSFYDGGNLSFFTLKEGESLSLEAAGYGKVAISQGDGRNIPTSLFENGKLARGVLAQDLVHHELGFKLPKGSGIAFDEDHPDILSGVFFQIPMPFQTKTNLLQVSKMQWDLKVYSFQVSEAFTFQPPNGAPTIEVPANAVVKVTHDREIVGILIPTAKNSGL